MTVYTNKKTVVKVHVKNDTGLQIIVDTREQKPLWTYNCMRKKLLVGDYTTIKLSRKFIVERKSPGDLYGTITGGHERFKKEIKRAIENNITLVVFVESTKQNFINKKFNQGNKRKYPSSGLERIITTLGLRYDLEFVWCNNRSQMKEKIIQRFKKEER